ncbi:MAG: DNA translocase FtsK [Victivallales bacterium]|nr:DNA translocase FtsK [Victivallales bacterium]
MALASESLRILAPVSGHDYAGIEVPNRHPDPVLAGNLFASSAWTESKALLPLIVGKDIEGKNIVTDLARAPHLLVAGTTGSGKSVLLNSFIVSLVKKFTPDELQLLLIDPKFVEMQAYNRLPHLVVPVINDAQFRQRRSAPHWVFPPPDDDRAGRRQDGDRRPARMPSRFLSKVQLRSFVDFRDGRAFRREGRKLLRRQHLLLPRDPGRASVLDWHAESQ